MKNVILPCVSLLMLMVVGIYTTVLSEDANKVVRLPNSPEPTYLIGINDGLDFVINNTKKNIARLTLERSFHKPLRITLDFKTKELVTEIWPYREDKAGDKFVQNTALDQAYIESVARVVKNKFLASTPLETEAGLDGAMWVVEVSWEGKYYSSSIWSPGYGAEHELGEILFNRAQRYASLGPLY